ncbi:LysR family transcriptional regulator, partial [bacterium]|nr:LysR family transcriptional regulator [bacterium]
MLPSITQLQYILSVHRHKHFGRAATECAVSQPSLSAQVQKVEEALGIVIFDRSKKPIITTAKGLEVIKQAKQVLLEHRKIQDIAADHGELSGEFRLGIIPTLASYVLPLFIESFSKRFPDVSLIVSENKTEDILRLLQDDELDAGLLVTPLYNSSFIERVLFYEDFFLFVAKGHELASRKVIQENDLEHHSVWLLEEGHCFRDQVLKVCALNEDRPVLANLSFASGHLETLINLIRRGQGCTLLPYLATLDLHEREKKHLLKPFLNPVPT